MDGPQDQTPSQLTDQLLDWMLLGRERYDDVQARQWLEQAVAVCADSSADLKALGEWVMALSLGHDAIDPDGVLLLRYAALARMKAQDKNGIAILSTALKMVDQTDWLDPLGRDFDLNQKKNQRPLQLALTGRVDGPRLDHVVKLLTQNQIANRLQAGLDIINAWEDI